MARASGDARMLLHTPLARYLLTREVGGRTLIEAVSGLRVSTYEQFLSGIDAPELAAARGELEARVREAQDYVEFRRLSRSLGSFEPEAWSPEGAGPDELAGLQSIIARKPAPVGFRAASKSMMAPGGIAEVPLSELPPTARSWGLRRIKELMRDLRGLAKKGLEDCGEFESQARTASKKRFMRDEIGLSLMFTVGGAIAAPVSRHWEKITAGEDLSELDANMALRVVEAGIKVVNWKQLQVDLPLSVFWTWKGTKDLVSSSTVYVAYARIVGVNEARAAVDMTAYFALKAPREELTDFGSDSWMRWQYSAGWGATVGPVQNLVAYNLLSFLECQGVGTTARRGLRFGIKGASTYFFYYGRDWFFDR